MSAMIEMIPDLPDNVVGGAMWEDGVIGTRHAMRWERIAVVTGTDWVRHTVGVFGFLVPGMVKVFDLGEEAAARAWVTT